MRRRVTAKEGSKVKIIFIFIFFILTMIFILSKIEATPM